MTIRKAEKPKRKNDQRLDAFGEIFVAAPPVKAWVEHVRKELDRGESEETIRDWVLQRAQEEGISAAKILLPSLNREGRRLSFMRFVKALADQFSGGKELRKLGDAVDAFCEALGHDEWLADAVLHMAKTGEALPLLPLLTGRVWVQERTVGGEQEPVVWAVASAYSDPRELADEFYAECKRVFPAHTWSRSGRNAEGARFCRLRAEGLSDHEIAEENLGAEELERLEKQGPAIRKARVAEETDRVRKARERFMEYLDRMPDELSG